MTGLHDLDELILTVRNNTSKTYITEAVNAYKGGAYRSSIVSIWITIVYDIISKIKEIAEQGDKQAQKEVKGLEKYIENKQIKDLQNFENEILDKAFENFEFISEIEYKHLTRIKEDRNVSAHPAFTGNETLFEPNAELVKSHIVNTVKYLLQHKPTQGKAAFENIINDVKRNSFPKDYNRVKEYLQTKYFDKVKEVLVKNVIKGFTEGLLNGEVAKDNNELNIINTLKTISEIYPEVFETELKKKLPNIIQSIEDENFWHLLKFIGQIEQVWYYLDKPTKIRIIEFVKTQPTDVSTQTLKTFVFVKSLKIAELNEALVYIKNLVSKKVNNSIHIYGNSRSYEMARVNGIEQILPMLPYFDADSVKLLVNQVLENRYNQILSAANTEDILLRVFEETEGFFTQTKPYWEKLLPKLEKDDYYRDDKYKTLIKRIKN